LGETIGNTCGSVKNLSKLSLDSFGTPKDSKNFPMQPSF